MLLNIISWSIMIATQTTSHNPKTIILFKVMKYFRICVAIHHGFTPHYWLLFGILFWPELFYPDRVIIIRDEECLECVWLVIVRGSCLMRWIRCWCPDETWQQSPSDNQRRSCQSATTDSSDPDYLWPRSNITAGRRRNWTILVFIFPGPWTYSIHCEEMAP